MKATTFFFFNLQKVQFCWCEKMEEVKINSFFQTCLACSKLSTAWLRAGCERQGNNGWAVLCSGSLSQHPLLKAVGISILQVPTGYSRKVATLPLAPAALSAHNHRNSLTISRPICRLLELLPAAWCVAGSAPSLQKIMFYSKFFLQKATEEEKSPSWSQGQIWCLCAVKPHFFLSQTNFLICWQSGTLQLHKWDFSRRSQTILQFGKHQMTPFARGNEIIIQGG